MIPRRSRACTTEWARRSATLFGEYLPERRTDCPNAPCPATSSAGIFSITNRGAFAALSNRSFRCADQEWAPSAASRSPDAFRAVSSGMQELVDGESQIFERRRDQEIWAVIDTANLLALQQMPGAYLVVDERRFGVEEMRCLYESTG